MSLDFSYEKKLRRRGYGVVVGVDEVGVGPLAGAVVSCAVTWPAIFNFPSFAPTSQGFKGRSKASEGRQLSIFKQFKNLKDSKKLSPKRRGEFFDIFTKDLEMYWAVASVMPRTIDRIGIFRANKLAMERAVRKLEQRFLPFLYGRVKKAKRRYGGLLLVDGRNILDLPMEQIAIIKGDESIPIIAIASIIAKVTRDRAMMRYHKKYPEYGFDRHKGYGTRLHFEMLRKYGPCPIHRKSFRLA